MTIRERVLEVANDVIGDLPEDVSEDTVIVELHLDSLDFMDLMFEIEENFDIEISDKDAEDWRVLGDIVRCVEYKLKHSTEEV